MSKLYTHILLDASSSMTPNIDATLSSVEEYVDSLRKKNTKARISVTKFNSSGTVVLRDAVPVGKFKSISKEEYSPKAMTPLHDAICKTIKSDRGTNLVKKGRYAFVIVTDGWENKSKKYDLDDARKMIKKLRKDGCLVVYLGADVDAFAEGKKLGISCKTTANFSKDHSGDTLKLAGLNVAAYAATGKTKSAEFTDIQRIAMKRGSSTKTG